MRFAGNVIWFVFGGGIIALGWLVGGLFAAISIVGLPLARAAFEMAKLSAFPFGKDVIHVRELDGKGTNAVTALTGSFGFIINVLWVCTFGWVLFLGYIFAGIINCMFLITIPFGLQSFKLAGLSFWPVGRRVVPIDIATEVRRRNASEKVNKIRGKVIS